MATQECYVCFESGDSLIMPCKTCKGSVGYCHKECANKLLQQSLNCPICKKRFEGIVTHRVVDIGKLRIKRSFFRQPIIILVYLWLRLLLLFIILGLMILLLHLYIDYFSVFLQMFFTYFIMMIGILSMGLLELYYNSMMNTIVRFLIRLKWIDETMYSIERGVSFV